MPESVTVIGMGGPADKKTDAFLFRGVGPDLAKLQSASRRELRLKARSQWLITQQALQAQQQQAPKP